MKPNKSCHQKRAINWKLLSSVRKQFGGQKHVPIPSVTHLGWDFQGINVLFPQHLWRGLSEGERRIQNVT